MLGHLEMLGLVILGNNTAHNPPYFKYMNDFYLRSPLRVAASSGGIVGANLDNAKEVFQLFADSVDFLEDDSEARAILQETGYHAFTLEFDFDVFRKILIPSHSGRIIETAARCLFHIEGLAPLFPPRCEDDSSQCLLGTILTLLAWARSLPSFNTILAKESTLHLPELHCNRARPWHGHAVPRQTPTSLSMLSSWAFLHWQNSLRKAGRDIEKFVEQELNVNDNPLTTAGWRKETLLALFEYDFTIYTHSSNSYICHRCWNPHRGKLVQPHWLKLLERIKAGSNPDEPSSPETKFIPPHSYRKEQILAAYSKNELVCTWCWEDIAQEMGLYYLSDQQEDAAPDIVEEVSPQDDFSPFHIHT